MQNVPARHSFHLIGQERLNAEGATVCRHEFDLVRYAVSVHEHNGPHIAGNQPKRTQILPQSGKVMFEKHWTAHEISLSLSTP